MYRGMSVFMTVLALSLAIMPLSAMGQEAVTFLQGCGPDHLRQVRCMSPAW